MGVGALLSRPLRRGGSPIFALGVVSTLPRRWTPAEVALVEEAAERTWEAAERGRAEAALRESEARYRTLFDTMGQGYCQLELIRDADGRAIDQLYLELNPAFERLFGIPVAEAKGRRASEVFPEVDPNWHAWFDKVVRGGAPERIEHQHRDRWYEALAYPAGGDRVTILYEDVTERKQAEIALQESEERQRFLLALGDAMRAEPSASGKIDAAARHLGERLGASRVLYAEYDWVEGFAHIFSGWFADGAQPFPKAMRLEDYEGKVLNDLRAGWTVRIDDIGRRIDEPAFAAIAAVGVQALLSVPLIVDGELKVNLSIHQHEPRHWTDGEVALVQEVAERLWAEVVRARSEAALRDSEERFQQFAENSRDLLWIVDGETGRLEYLSRAYEQIFGEPPEAVMQDLGRWGELVHPDDREAAKEGMPRLRRGEVEAFTQEYRIVRPADGRVCWIRDTGFPIRDEAGRVRRTGGIAQDITERRCAEEALRESEERLRQFGEASSDVLWIRDVGTLEWEYLSPAFESIYGESREAALSGDTLKNWAGLILPEDRESALDNIDRVMAGERVTFEYRVRRPADGQVRWLRNTDFPIFDAAGRVRRIGGIGKDITEERRAAEHQRMLLAELQHRVRNTLGVIRSIARRTAETSETVEDYSMHLDGRINAFARVQSAVTREPAGGVDLEYLVAEELVAYGAHEGDQVAGIHGPKVLLQPKAAETIALAVHELATNAVKYGALSTPGGRVTVSWTITRDGEGPMLVLSWSESGLRLESAEPRRRGFGTELLERTLAYELKAKAKLDLGKSGLRCMVEIPATERIIVSGQF
jgi:PAS domain S-box-containing protein